MCFCLVFVRMRISRLENSIKVVIYPICTVCALVKLQTLGILGVVKPAFGVFLVFAHPNLTRTKVSWIRGVACGYVVQFIREFP